MCICIMMSRATTQRLIEKYIKLDSAYDIEYIIDIKESQSLFLITKTNHNVHPILSDT